MCIFGLGEAGGPRPTGRYIDTQFLFGTRRAVLNSSSQARWEVARVSLYLSSTFARSARVRIGVERCCLLACCFGGSGKLVPSSKACLPVLVLPLPVCSLTPYERRYETTSV